MRRGTRWIGAMVALAVLLMAMPLIAVAHATGEIKQRSCGPAAGMTVADGRKGRIYVVNAYPDMDLDFFAVHKVSRLYGCLYDAERSWRLDRQFERSMSAFFSQGTMHFHAPWVAVAQATLDGLDTGRRDVIAVNLRTGRARVCPVTPFFEDEWIEQIVVTRAGKVGWLGTVSSGDGGYPILPSVGVCGPAESAIIDRGAAIDLDSLALSDSTLSWINAGAMKSYEL